METVFNELLRLLEKTVVTVEFDRTKIRYSNDGYEGEEAGIVPNEEDQYFYYTVKVDGYSKFIRYSERIDELIQEFEGGIENQLNDKSYYFNVKKHLEKIKSTVVPIYSNPDIISFSDQFDRRERVSGNKSESYFEPNIYVKYINGTDRDSDFEEFNVIKKFVDKKIYLARRIEAIVKTSLELLKEQGGGKKFETFKFKDARLLDSPRFTDFRKGLIENGLIDKINASLFAKCFSGKEVTEKVNWKHSQLSLTYFVRQLYSKKLIENENQWIALSHSFLYKGGVISPKTFSTINQKKVPNIEIRGIIDELINGIALKSPVLPPK